MVVNNSAVGADRNIYTCLLEILVTLSSNFYYSCGLSASDTLRLTGDADGTAADTDLDEVSSCICKESETLTVYYVACADFY